MVGRVKPLTRADRERFEMLHAMPCLCCDGEQPSRTTIHHLLSGGRRRGHQYTVNLCEWHHYARPVVVTRSSIEGHTEAWMAERYGPSLLMESKAFHERYGSDDELLAKVNELISEAA